jgi:hypothetical protein
MHKDGGKPTPEAGGMDVVVSEGSPSETGSEAGAGGPAACPTGPCTGETCCADTGDGGSLGCAATCPAEDTLDCTAPSDCGGSKPWCCVTAVFMGGGTAPACLRTTLQSVKSTCSTEKACPADVHLTMACNNTDVTHLCTTSADCPGTTAPACCDLTIGAVTYSACVPSLFMLSGATCH